MVALQVGEWFVLAVDEALEVDVADAGLRGSFVGSRQPGCRFEWK